MSTRLLLGAGFLCAFLSATSVQAADRLEPGEGPDWNGWYWGAQAGVGVANHTLTETNAVAGPFQGFNGVGVPHEVSGEGFIGGAHLGWRAQTGNFVYGFEGDFNFADNVAADGFISINGSNTNNIVGFDARWTASARVTAGITAGDFLFYGTGGFAWLDGELGLTSTFPLDASDDFTLNGFTVGAGVEHRINERISWKLEYQHMEFNDVTTSGTITAPAVQTFNFDNSVELDTFMVKLSFKLP